MRLINTNTLELKEFDYPEVPPYATLSHTWTEHEVLYEDLLRMNRLPNKEGGWAKIDQTCKRARDSGFEYCWIDTCCIYKKNHAELSEAINSMYNWYKEAEICYAYLADITLDQNKSAAKNLLFLRSHWFTRG